MYLTLHDIVDIADNVRTAPVRVLTYFYSFILKGFKFIT